MEMLVILLLLYLVAALIIFPIWAMIKIGAHNTEMDALRQRLSYLDAELKELQIKLRQLATAKPAEPPVSTAVAARGNPRPIGIGSSITSPSPRQSPCDSNNRGRLRRLDRRPRGVHSRRAYQHPRV